MSCGTRPSRPGGGYDLFGKWSWISGCLLLNLADYPIAVRVRFPHEIPWSTRVTAEFERAILLRCASIVRDVLPHEFDGQGQIHPRARFFLTFSLLKFSLSA